MFDTNDQKANEKEKAHRRLQQLEKSGQLTMLDPGDKTTNTPARWGSK